MKKWFILCLLLVQYPVVAFANANADALLDEATVAYHAGDYAKALEIYQTINLTHESADLYLNMGHCTYQLNQLGNTILYYERTLHLQPGNKEVLTYLSEAKQQVDGNLQEQKESNIGRSFKNFLYTKSAAFWRILTVILLALAFLLFAIGLKRALKRRKLIRAIGTCMLVIAVATFTVSYEHHQYFYSDHSGIILSRAVKVKQEANLLSNNVMVLHEGTKVQTGISENGWVQITLPSGKIGYVSTRDIAII